ncbi:MAG: hypothetical protein LUG49_02545 [Oscillospiraceae bacterium]|nr:hypothetical protein [Oscillospiraceae bacterium]
MKKYITIITALALVLALSIGVFADEIIEDTDDESFDYENEVVENVKIEAYDEDEFEYLFLFGTADVNFLDDYALQYRSYTYGTEYTELSDLYEVDGDYMVPTVDSSGNFVGYAEGYKEEDGSWYIIGVSQGYSYELLYELIANEKICEGYSSAFIGGDAFFNSFGLVLSDGTDEIYFDFYSYAKDVEASSLDTEAVQLSDYFISADYAAERIVEMAEGVIESDASDSEGLSGGGSVDFSESNPTTGAFLVLSIPAVALGVAIVSKKRK